MHTLQKQPYRETALNQCPLSAMMMLYSECIADARSCVQAPVNIQCLISVSFVFLGKLLSSNVYRTYLGAPSGLVDMPIVMRQKHRFSSLRQLSYPLFCFDTHSALSPLSGPSCCMSVLPLGGLCLNTQLRSMLHCRNCCSISQ